MKLSLRHVLTMRASMTVGSTGPRRLLFLDGLRGLALILMVINHTSRWWMDVSMGWGRYYLVYGSVILPAPIFLFLVGFCLPISYRAASTQSQGYVLLIRKYFRRGLAVILAGFLLNLLVFPDDPVWSGGVLQTIGLSIIVLGAAMPFLRHRWARYGLLAIAVLLYLSFVWSFPALSNWLPAHPLVAQMWFLDFPPWPWLSGALIGLVLGWVWLDVRRRGEREEVRYFQIVALVGMAFLLAYFAWDWWMQTSQRFGFKRDFILNRHWTPRGVTNFLIIGGVACLLAATYWVMEVMKRELRWLVILGQTALTLYFLHQVIVLTLVNKALGWRFNHWVLYWIANVLLMVALVYIGKPWLEIKRLARQIAIRPAPSTS